MQLLFREYLRADCGCDVGAIQESDEDTVHENAIINDFLAAPDALSVLARILRELAEPSSVDGEEDLERLQQ
jgi:hypothetical protein